MLSHSSCVRLFVTPWTVAHQALLSQGPPHRGSTLDTEPGGTHSSLCRTHSGRVREPHSSCTPSSPSGFSPRHSRVRRGVLVRSEAKSSQAAADRFPFSSLQRGRHRVSRTTPGSLSAPQLSVLGPKSVQRSSQVKERSTKESEVAQVTLLYRMTFLICEI